MNKAKVAYEGWTGGKRAAKGLTAPRLVGVGVATGTTTSVVGGIANRHLAQKSYSKIKNRKQKKAAMRGGYNGVY